MNTLQSLTVAVIIATLTFVSSMVYANDPLPSWNDGKAKQSIVTFVQKVTTTGSPDYVPTEERIAVFDNDGTLWPENPLPFQMAYTTCDHATSRSPSPNGSRIQVY